MNLSDPSGEIIDTIWDVGNVLYDVSQGQWCDAFVDGAAAFVPGLPAGTTKVTRALGAAGDARKFTGTIAFKTEHASRHLAGTNLATDLVEQRIKNDIAQNGAAAINGDVRRTININGQNIEYRAHTLPDGSVSVGTYYPK